LMAEEEFMAINRLVYRERQKLSGSRRLKKGCIAQMASCCLINARRKMYAAAKKDGRHGQYCSSNMPIGKAMCDEKGKRPNTRKSIEFSEDYVRKVDTTVLPKMMGRVTEIMGQATEIGTSKDPLDTQEYRDDSSEEASIESIRKDDSSNSETEVDDEVSSLAADHCVLLYLGSNIFHC
jgi:hypothetical protein